MTKLERELTVELRKALALLKASNTELKSAEWRLPMSERVRLADLRMTPGERTRLAKLIER